MAGIIRLFSNSSISKYLEKGLILQSEIETNRYIDRKIDR